MLRTIIHYVALLSVLLLSSGCNKSSEDEPFDFYFVRYTAAVTAGESVKITYRNGDGKNISVNQECPDPVCHESTKAKRNNAELYRRGIKHILVINACVQQIDYNCCTHAFIITLQYVSAHSLSLHITFFCEPDSGIGYDNHPFSIQMADSLFKVLLGTSERLSYHLGR